MNLQVWEAYDELFPEEEVPSGYFGFISEQIEKAIKKELPGAYDCREYLPTLTAVTLADRSLIHDRTLKKGRFVQTIGPTGFPLISTTWRGRRFRYMPTMAAVCGSKPARPPGFCGMRQSDRPR